MGPLWPTNKPTDLNISLNTKILPVALTLIFKQEELEVESP